MAKGRILIWSKKAADRFDKTLERIRKEVSPSYAQKVEDAILSRIDELPSTPEIHAPDRFKENNNGNFRAFEEINYRVSYRFDDKKVVILQVRHVKQKPIRY